MSSNLHNQQSNRVTRPRNHVLRWIGRIVFGIIGMVLLLILVGAGWQWFATQADRRAYPPPGELIDVGDYRMHIYCIGEGNPTVILDALGDGTSAHWGWVQPTVAATTRVCAYDRAGRGWSDIGPEPRDGLVVAQELHTLMTNAQIIGPKVLAGHSFGGMIARLYADLYPEEVAGMVLVDTGLPGLRSDRMPAEARAQTESEMGLMNAAPWMARLGIFRLLGSGATLPEPQRSQVQVFYASNTYWDSLRADALRLTNTDAQVEATGSLGARPLLIIAATMGWVNPNVSMDESRRVYNTMQQELLPLSTNSAYREVEGASHASLVLNEVHAAQVSASIVEVVEAVRTGAQLAR